MPARSAGPTFALPECRASLEGARAAEGGPGNEAISLQLNEIASSACGLLAMTATFMVRRGARLLGIVRVKRYVTVTPELRVEVSRRIREGFESERDYCKLHGAHVTPPVRPLDPPAEAALRWHCETVFRG
jgi:hypothetical protein